MASCSSNSPSSSSGGSFFLSYFGETEFNELLQLLGPGIEAGPDVNVASMTSRSFEDDTGGPSSSGLLSGPELDYYHIPVDIGNDTAKASSSSSSSLPVAGNDIDLSSYDTSILSTAISPIVNLARELGAYRIPRQPLRDELVRLYFRAVHPVFPVINEIDFCRSYFPSEGRELPEDIPLILFQAMMFAAFAHVNNTELRRSGFQSIHEAQYKTFQKVKLLYATARERNHLLLAKVSVLLSLWSPQDSSMHVNSYWVGRAVHHIRLSHASRPLNCSEKPRDRRRIVAWCCHNRDTMVAFGLRRPYRMHDLSRLISAMNPGQLHHDFDAHGSGIFDSVVIDETSRNRMISNFIWHCKFCQHIRTIVAFQRDLHFQKSWAGPDGDTIDDEHIRQVQEMTSKLGMLSLEHDDIIRSNPTASQSNSILVFDSVHPYMMKIMNLSTIVQLYLPYVNFDGSAACDEFSQEAVQKMRKASHAVASICGRLLAAVTLQHVPVYM
ncbi:hypothetical protein MAP00_007775 [Monascus purpureus]|nr:hypothetical protein MAP00_007775 [Monascus purpureus]